MNEIVLNAVNCKGTLTMSLQKDKVRLIFKYTGGSLKDTIETTIGQQELQNTLWLKNICHDFQDSGLRRVVRRVREHDYGGTSTIYRTLTTMEMYTTTTSNGSNLMIVKWADLREALTQMKP